MGMFAETVIVKYCLSFADQEKQTSIFSFLCLIILFLERKHHQSFCVNRLYEYQLSLDLP
jgi:hypothetical protein